MKYTLAVVVVIFVIAVVKAQCPPEDPIYVEAGYFNFTYPGPGYDLIRVNEGSTHDGTSFVGHSSTYLNLGYNIITQVVSFQIGIPEMQIDGIGYYATGEINASPFRPETIPRGPFVADGEFHLHVTNMYSEGTIAILVNLITNNVTIRSLNINTWTFDQVAVNFGHFESSQTVVDWDSWNAMFKSNFYTDFETGKTEIQSILKAPLDAWIADKNVTDLIDILLPPAPIPCEVSSTVRTTTRLTTTTSTTTTTRPTTTTMPPDRNCTEGGIYFVPYPGNCSMYMVCSNFELQEELQICLPGTLFDPDLGQCNIAENVHCRPVCPPSGIVTLPHARNCSLYWICSNGNAALEQCLPGMYFDQFEEECNIADHVMCPLLCPPIGVINLPHNMNCTLYWTCVNGQAKLQACPPKLLFDRDLAQCNLEEAVNCGESASVSLRGDIGVSDTNQQLREQAGERELSGTDRGK